MEELKIGDLVETCQFLPGFITSIDGDDVEVFIPGKHDFNSYFNKAAVYICIYDPQDKSVGFYCDNCPLAHFDCGKRKEFSK